MHAVALLHICAGTGGRLDTLAPAAALARSRSLPLERAHITRTATWGAAPWSQRAPLACRGSQGCALRLRGGSDAEAPAPDFGENLDWWRGQINMSTLITGPYDPLPQPSPLGESSSTLSDVSSDPLYPEEEQRRIRHEIKEEEARHGASNLDPFVGKTYKVLERVLDPREYRTYWRPVCMCVCMYACMHAGMYGCMHACMYVYTYAGHR